MAFTDEEQKIIDSTLRLDDLGDIDGPTLNIELTKREVRLLLDALDYFRETRCPVEDKGDECAMMFWAENSHSGAVERICIGRCNRIVSELLGEKTEAAFGQGRK